MGFYACGKQAPIEIQTQDDGTVVRFKAEKKYLLLPIEDSGNELRVGISVENEKINEFVLRPAQNQIDYWVPLDLSDWQGKEVRLNIPQMGETAIFPEKPKQSDTFEFDQNEKYRPTYHFTPPYGWMNDPNGMVYYGGEYHLFYQYNPFGTRWQNMSWGHAISNDLIHWEHLPVALMPDSLGTIFSGSAVVDENNIAGFQTGEEKTLLAFYTQSERGGQWQSLAYSNDKGRTWTKYAKNPILKHPTASDFRDPKVFWHEAGGKWIMILAVGQVMEIYSSVNAIDWTYESNFGEGYGSHNGVWECPDLFELPVEGTNEKRWVLICNINPGGPSGGSATQYFIGNFDGKTFTCDSRKEETYWLDWGKDHYALVSWSDVPKEDGRRIGIAWMNNWEYANDLPTVNFRSAMSIPRELKLIKQDGHYLLTNYPVKETEILRTSQKELENIHVAPEYYSGQLIENDCESYELLINIENDNADVIGFKLFNGKGEYVDFYISLSEKKFYSIDRKNSGKIDFSNTFSTITSAPISVKKEYRLRILIDKCSIECFENQGEISMTNLIFPSEPYKFAEFYAKGGEYKIKKIQVYNLR